MYLSNEAILDGYLSLKPNKTKKKKRKTREKRVKIPNQNKILL